MCGIHGIVYFNKVDIIKSKSKVDLMLNVTKHRGPDEKEIRIYGQAILGTNRLSIVAPNEHSTIQTDKQNLSAIFNGEIVNFKNLIKLLKYPPKDEHTDSAIILPLFKQLGPNFAKKLAGMFAIAIYDDKRNSLQLFRDPLGVKPLYYFFDQGKVIFSSELKAIYAVLDKTPEIDFAGLDHSLKYRFHPGQSSIFPQIKRVLPGEAVSFKDNQIERLQYWSLRNNSSRKSKKYTALEFRNLFKRVLREQSEADVKGGFFVSGGLDSSLVTSMVLKMGSKSYKKPISIRFLPLAVEDEGYGEILEKYLKTKFEWVEITNKIARDSLMEISKFIDEPLENPIHVGTFLMAKRAHELGIKTVLTGDGSDEFFLGYQRHACWFNKREDPTIAYPKWLWTLTPDNATELYTKTANRQIKPMLGVDGREIEPFECVEDALRFERLERLSEYHNMRLDRMTMANGIEARVPFMDHRVVDYVLNIPVKSLIGPSGKAWLQQIALSYLPKQIIQRKKIHFPSLPDQWLEAEGSDWAAQILLDKGAYTKKWIKSKVLEDYILEHKKKNNRHGRMLWALIVLELWLKNITSLRRVI